MLTKIEIITRSTKLDDLLRALNKIGVMGITVSQVFDTCERVLRTGQFGDGKIFVTELKDAVRIRTGQHGDDAIRDIPGETTGSISA